MRGLCTTCGGAGGRRSLCTFSPYFHSTSDEDHLTHAAQALALRSFASLQKVTNMLFLHLKVNTCATPACWLAPVQDHYAAWRFVLSALVQTRMDVNIDTNIPNFYEYTF